MTEIFKSYEDFLQRADKNVNGVSTFFPQEYPDWEEMNKNNKGCWNCSDCSDCNRCSDCSDCSDCNRCIDCSYCIDCSRCSDCSYCSSCSSCSDCSYCIDCSRCSDCGYCSSCSYCIDCSRCSDCSYCIDCSRCSDCGYCNRCSSCSDCSRCSDLNNAAPSLGKAAFESFDIPLIENIHQKILDAVTVPNALNMDTWHTCDTTHCRAGWVIHLAGAKGYELESKTSPVFAAIQIYKASSEIKVSPPRFYETNEVAFADIKRCAELEAALKK